MCRTAFFFVVFFLSAQSLVSAGVMLHAANSRGDAQVLSSYDRNDEDQNQDEVPDDRAENLGENLEAESYLSSNSNSSSTAFDPTVDLSTPPDLRWRIDILSHPMPPTPFFEPTLEPS